MRSPSTSCHQIARLSSFEKNTHTPYARPQNVVSTMRTVFCGAMSGSEISIWSRCLRTHTCERRAACASCFNVCLQETYDLHSFSRILFLRRADWNDRPHSRQRYHCTPRGEPFFFVNRDPHERHGCPFF